MGKYHQAKAILADPAIKEALVSVSPTCRQNQSAEEKRAELYSLGKIYGFLHDQRRSLSRSSKFNGFSA
jgi:hypothetical protein